MNKDPFTWLSLLFLVGSIIFLIVFAVTRKPEREVKCASPKAEV